MVHALERAAGWLAPGGRLVDMHPHPDPPQIRVRRPEATLPAGWLRETDDRIEYEQADAALAEVVRRGRLAVVRRETFLFHTYADSLAELREYLAKNWQDAVVEDLVAMRVEALLHSAAGKAEIVLRERVRIAALQTGGGSARP